MPRTIEITNQMFRDWLSNADGDDVSAFMDELYEDVLSTEGKADAFIAMSDEDLSDHMKEVIDCIEFLEEEDFFGTEGFEKRFA